ncbi:MAG: hypothetical protein KAG66_19075, partial [Methylococcales bacterium]|nr:hypothetical protein [Methylococcales bacterium]
MAYKHKKTGPAARQLTWQISTIVLLLATAGNAHAIPSPDLVINLSASVAQLLGLLSVVFGGFALSSKKGIKKRNARSSRIARI